MELMDEKPFLVICHLAKKAQEVASVKVFTPVEETKMIQLAEALQLLVVLYATDQADVPKEYLESQGKLLDNIKRSFKNLT